MSSSEDCDDDVNDGFGQERETEESEAEDSPQRSNTDPYGSVASGVFDDVHFGDAGDASFGDSFLFGGVEYQSQGSDLETNFIAAAFDRSRSSKRKERTGETSSHSEEESKVSAAREDSIAESFLFGSHKRG